MMKNMSIFLVLVLTGFFGFKIYAEGDVSDSSQGILNKDYANRVVEKNLLTPMSLKGS